MNYNFEGYVVLITGGSSGIGKATALAFANSGAEVIIASRGQIKGEQIEKELQKISNGSRWIKTDTSDAAEIKMLFDTIKDSYGRLDVAFNNSSSGGATDKIHLTEIDDWEKTIQGTLNSVFMSMKYELEIMYGQKSGSIINNSSVDSMRAFPYHPAYSAAKHGVNGLTKSSAVQYANDGIRINAICPGWIDTPPIKRVIESGFTEQSMLAHQPIGRFGTPEEVSNLVLWLASDASSFMLGGTIPIDGGYTVV